MERQEGYYWVKIDGYFTVGYFNIAYWFLVCDIKSYKDSDFEHINENRIKAPGELPD